MSKLKINILLIFLTFLFLSSCLSPQLHLLGETEIEVDCWDYYLQRHDLNQYINGKRKCNVTISKKFNSNIEIKNIENIVLIISNIGNVNEICTDFKIGTAYYANDILKVSIYTKWNKEGCLWQRTRYDYYFIERPSEWELFQIQKACEGVHLD